MNTEPDPYEVAARKAGWIDKGDIWGIHHPNDDRGGGFGGMIYATWRECCERENIKIEG